MSYQLSRHPLTQSCGHTKLTVIPTLHKCLFKALVNLCNLFYRFSHPRAFGLPSPEIYTQITLRKLARPELGSDDLIVSPTEILEATHDYNLFSLPLEDIRCSSLLLLFYLQASLLVVLFCSFVTFQQQVLPLWWISSAEYNC